MDYNSIYDKLNILSIFRAQIYNTNKSIYIRSNFQYCIIARFSPIAGVYDCLKDIVFTKHIIHVPHLYFRAKIDNGIKSIYAQGKNCYVIKTIISISAGPPSVLH